MSPETALQIALALPVAASVLALLFGDRPNLREGAAIVCGGLLTLVVFGIARGIDDGREYVWAPFEMLPGVDLAFRVERLGLLFSGVAAVLWPVTTLYAAGYMRGHHEKNQTRFFTFFALAIFAAIGAAYAANLLTLFVFYEVMTLATYPLVTHHGDEKARRGGRIYLGILIFTSVTFLLLAIIWTWRVAGTMDFRPGGILSTLAEDGSRDPLVSHGLLIGLLALYAFGIGKAALMPFHRWLPSAMVAPTPVSALLHAVAVVKVGVFSVLKVVVYVFGIDLLAQTGASVWLGYVAGFTLLTASLIAMRKDNLKERLAYSTVSQLAYIVLGAALANGLGILGGGLHIVTHAVGKITLFFCAGAIYVAAHETEISAMKGLGRKMPITFGAFAIAATSVIGLPPAGGSWSKWYLALGAADAGAWILVGALMLSTLLNIAYLVPIPLLAFFGEPDRDRGPGRHEAPAACVVPLALTALGCLALFFLLDPVARFLEPIAGLATETGR
ncbi:MAG: proton-conducting transporter membrane subunit [Planctomycetota bacterium]